MRGRAMSRKGAANPVAPRPSPLPARGERGSLTLSRVADEKRPLGPLSLSNAR